MVVAPEPHPSGARAPVMPAELVPRHVAIVMDGNGRWAKQRGLPRTEGHKAGEASLLDVIKGGIEIGVKYISAYAFSTENWARSPEEVRFLMGFNREVIHRRRDELDAMGVRVVWSGRRPRLWKSVIDELEYAQERTKDNDTITLQFCVNYGGQAEIADAMRSIARGGCRGQAQARTGSPRRRSRKHLYAPDIPEVDLFVRSSGEQRTSNFLVWQLAYAEMVFLDTLWPDFDRRDLWRAIELYAQRDRRYGGAVPNRRSRELRTSTTRAVRRRRRRNGGEPRRVDTWGRLIVSTDRRKRCRTNRRTNRSDDPAGQVERELRAAQEQVRELGNILRAALAEDERLAQQDYRPTTGDER